MPVFDSRSFKDHEQIVFCNDRGTGLKAIIAIHSTALGPATGGTRFWDYMRAYTNVPFDMAQTRAEEDALYDVLRLSRGMSYKNALAGLRLGGGKSVIIGNPKQIGSPDLMRAFGHFINTLSGHYYAAEDVGTTPQMMQYARERTEYLCGLEEGAFATGDPSPHTARGVFEGIKASVRHRLGQSDLKGIRVAVQGVGHVGHTLVKHLLSDGAIVKIADISQSNIEATLALGQVDVVDKDTIHAEECDVFSPCALGGGINSRTIAQIKAKVIAGAANNQLEREIEDGEALRELGILYAPDYVINAGGIIAVESEVYKQPVDNAARREKVLRIGETLTSIFKISERDQRSTNMIANEMAEDIILSAETKKAAE